jgi:hypothetical protein
VRPYRPEDGPAWDAFVRAARVPHFLFERAYMDYHSDRFEDASRLVEVDGALAAVLPANRDGTTIWSHQGLTFGGLLSGAAMTARRTLEAFAALTDHLQNEGVTRLIYKAVPHIYHAAPAEEDLYALHRHGATLSRRDLSSAIDLARAPAYRKGRKASLKRARESGLRARPSDDFGAFMAIEEATLARHGATSTHSAEELSLLASRFPDQITLHVVEDVAGVVVYRTPVLDHAQYIGSTEQGREVGAVDLLIDALIERARADGKRWFDFGISTTDDGRHLNEGLVRNKESYGARGVAYDRYELDLKVLG